MTVCVSQFMNQISDESNVVSSKREFVDWINLFFYEHLHLLMIVRKKLIEIDAVSKIVIDNHVRTSIRSTSWRLISLFPYRGGGGKPHRFWTSNRGYVFDMRRYTCGAIMNSLILEIYLLDFFYIRHSWSSSIDFVIFRWRVGQYQHVL